MWKQFNFCPAFFLALNREFEAFLSLFSFYDKNYTFPLSALFVEYKRLKMLFSKLFYSLILTQNTRTAQYTLSFSLSHTHTHTHILELALARSTHTWRTFLYISSWRDRQHTFFWDFEDLKLLWQPSHSHTLYHISWCKFGRCAIV